MALALTDAEQDVLRGLAAVLAHGATERFVASPLIVHDREHFPEDWSNDLRSVRDALRRLLLHAGLPQIGVDLQDVREGNEFAPDVAVMFVELVDGVARFCVAATTPPEHAVASIALQIPRVWAQWSGYGSAAAGPYRDQDLDEPEEITEADASLIMVTLGLGVFAVNSAEVLTRETGDGGYIRRQSRIAEIGGLAPPLCTFALAVHLVVRGIDGDALDAIRRALSPECRRWLMKEVARLRPWTDALRQTLGLPDPATWPAPQAIHNEPLPADPASDEALGAAERAFKAELAVPNRNRVVFRVAHTSTIAGALVGGVLGVGAVVVLMTLGVMRPAVAGLGAVIGYAIGRRIRRVQCSDPACEHIIGDDDEHCPGCGGFVAGQIASVNERLAAEDTYEAQQLAAADEGDGAGSPS